MSTRYLLLLAASACVLGSNIDSDKKDTVTDPPPGTTDTGPYTPPPPLDEDGDGVASDLDCNDADATVYPGAVEICDGVDNDCDKLVDDAAPATFGGVNYPSISEAVGAALIAPPPGTASEPTDLPPVDICASPKNGWPISPLQIGNGQSLRLRGIQGREATMLVSVKGDSLLRVSGTGSLVVEGLTLTGAIDASAVEALDEALLFVTDAEISGNADRGVDINGDRSGVTAIFTRTNLVTNAAAGEGGGLRAFAVFDVRFTDSLINGNSASSGAGIHAIAELGNGSLTLSGTTVSSNDSSGDGGGIYAESGFMGTTTLGLDTSLILDNTAVRGGGIYALGVPVVGDGLSSVSGNSATDGGGLVLQFAGAQDLFVHGNTAEERGGGVLADSAGRSLQYVLQDLDIRGNNAGLGGGLYVADDLAIVVAGSSVFASNSALMGGGAYVAVGNGASLESDGALWGRPGKDDNIHHDVFLGGVEVFFSFDGDKPQSFLCSNATNTCE